MTTEQEVTALSELSLVELVKKLHNDKPNIRSAAAINLCPFVNEAADDLLLQLSQEKCLYTRIAICESLEKGNIETSKKMINYLGIIGNNQHKVLPNKVSNKKSFPLPRDIIARSLGRMDVTKFPVLIEVLKGKHIEKIREALDAIGYMAFYNPILATSEHCKYVISLSTQYETDLIVLWKMILCLSAFSCKESKDFLLEFEKEQTILGMEAKRSLRILENRNRAL